MVKFTPKAAEGIKNLLKQQHEGTMVRLVMAGYGWGGPTIGLALDETVQERDKVWEVEDIKVVLQDNLIPYANGATIDMRKDFFGKEQFQVLTGRSC